MNLPPTDLPEPLASEARRAWLAVLETAGESLAQELAAALAGSSEEVQLPRVLGCSPFVADTLRRQPQLLLELIKSGDLQKALPVDHFHVTLQHMVNAGGADIASMLRRYRARHMVRIVWRDFSRLADTLETVRDTSSLAGSRDRCCSAVCSCRICREVWRTPGASQRRGAAVDCARYGQAGGSRVKRVLRYRPYFCLSGGGSDR